jgi:membrane protease YdiL (CAAX protease family)
MPGYEGSRLSPVVSLIYLLLLALSGAIVFGIVAILIGVLLFDISPGSLAGGIDVNNLSFLKLVQILSTGLGTFIVPAFVFARIQSPRPLSYLKLDTTTPVRFFFLTVLIMIVFGPFLEWTVLMNKQMHLPQFLKGLEQWMKSKESELALLTEKLLEMKSPGEFIVNFIMIALLPAIGEELIFRGCLQRILTVGLKNPHVAVWVAAIIFSAIHLQFYGFLPRMLLGALFGYLFLWSKNLWIPILAHFINNGVVVVMAYVYQLNGKTLDINENAYTPNPALYIASAIFAGLLLAAFYKQVNQNNEVRFDE